MSIEPKVAPGWAILALKIKKSSQSAVSSHNCWVSTNWYRLVCYSNVGYSMLLLALGVNHRTASVDLRERLAFAPESVPDVLQNVRERLLMEEVAILSTCNRTELYCTTQKVQVPVFSDRVIQWLGDYHHLPQQKIAHHAYVHWGEDAVRHMLRVASGLDSMVLGEPQILGQLKSAFSVAQGANTLGPGLGRLFQYTFRVAKTVRTQTEIGVSPISVAYAAVNLSKRIFSDLTQATVLLIGAGETIELVSKHFKQAGVSTLYVANRTFERAQDLSSLINATPLLLQDIPSVLPKADIIISSTASPLPIVGKGMMEVAMKQRKHAPTFLVDLAVPRDIEPQVGNLPDVFLYSVDDLQETVEQNKQQRQQAAEEAESIVAHQAVEFMQALRERKAVGILRHYREKVENMRLQEYEKARKALLVGQAPEVVLEKLSKTLANKLMHEPTVRLRRASALDKTEKLRWAQELLGLLEENENDEQDEP